MKILWFTNIPMPAMDRFEGTLTQGSGSWMLALLEKVSCNAEIRLAVATAYPGRTSAEFSDQGVDYFILGQSRKEWSNENGSSTLRWCQDVVEKWSPDIIHIHGTERIYGLLATLPNIKCPIVISIQGLIVPYSNWLNYFGELSFREIVKSHGIRELVLQSGLLFDYARFLKKAQQEQKIVVANSFFMGRTAWDRAHLTALNPNAHYFHVDEMIRPHFTKSQWSLSSFRPHSIIFTNSGQPRRGTEILLKAVHLLQHEFPDIELKLSGNISTKSGYGRALLKKIKTYRLSSNVKFLGYLNSETMAFELRTSHVFAISSYIENSPNSLCEAMLTGMPCVASYAGGIPSMITHEEDGLLFPIGEAAMLADNIRRIFRSSELAKQLGMAAHLRAMKRHNPNQVMEQLLYAYHQTIALGQRGGR